MPKLLVARLPIDEQEERTVRKLASARHAPGDWIRRAQIILASWEGQSTKDIATELGCHPQTVRERLHRFNTAGIEGLGDRPGAVPATSVDRDRTQPNRGDGPHRGPTRSADPVAHR